MAAISAVLLLLAPQAWAQAPAFAGSDTLSSDSGHALIEWDAPGTVTLEIADNADFYSPRTLYSGANHAYFVSGLVDGEYVLRLRDEDGEQSAPVSLQVRHQSLNQALWLALIGAIVTIAIVLTIIRGARDE